MPTAVTATPARAAAFFACAAAWAAANLLAWTLLSGGPKAVGEALRLFARNPVFWTLAGSVGFGVFYAGVTLASTFSPGWVVAATWQSTILATPLVLWTHLFLVLLIYFVGFWTRKGQTLAMRTWRIRLENREGRAPRPAQALLRYLLCWPSFGLFGIGIFWAWLDPDRQFLHDRLAGTHIVFC